jgi:hypothetical protein
MNIPQIPASVLFIASAAHLLSACWTTGGPGPGPYSQCTQPRDCAARDQTICLERWILPAATSGGSGEDSGSSDASGTSEGPTEPLFCSLPCPAEGAGGCPLSELHPDLISDCLGIHDSETKYCALTTNTDCPWDMLQYTVEDRQICVFPILHD